MSNVSNAWSTFGARLKAELSARNMSQTRYAQAMGMSYDTLNCYVNSRRIPSYRTLLTMVEYLPGVDIVWLVTGIAEQEDAQ